MFGLKGKNFIVLAGSKGMGFSVVESLAKEGANVVFCSRKQENVDNALNRLKQHDGSVHGLTCDNTVEDELVSFIQRSHSILGSLDGMVYNTGGPKPGVFESLSLDDWDYSYRLLIRSAVIATREFLRYSKPGSSVVYITSVAIKEPVENLVLSNSLRMAVAGLSKTLSRELADRKIRFNVVMPGYILTDRVRQLAMKKAEDKGVSVEEVLEDMVRDVPLKRLGEPEEIANTVLFLLSEYSSYINGAVIPVDGGLLRSVL